MRRKSPPRVDSRQGHPSHSVQDAEAYQRWSDIAARTDVYEAIRQGADDAARGRARPLREVFDELRRRSGIPR